MSTNKKIEMTLCVSCPKILEVKLFKSSRSERFSGIYFLAQKSKFSSAVKQHERLFHILYLRSDKKKINDFLKIKEN